MSDGLRVDGLGNNFPCPAQGLRSRATDGQDRSSRARSERRPGAFGGELPIIAPRASGGESAAKRNQPAHVPEDSCPRPAVALSRRITSSTRSVRS